MTDQTDQPSPGKPDGGGVSRRGLFRAAGVGAAVVGGGSLLEACSSSIKGASAGGSTASAASGKSITIGWIHPLTGDLAGFGAPDNWVISQIKETSPYKNGFKIGGSTYDVTIKSYDSQSSVTKAGDLAKQAIQQDNVDLLLASSTPETVNAVASQAETLGTPLVCANIPWEPWYINLGGNPQKPTLKPKYVTMYFLGAEHLALSLHPDVEQDRRPVRQQPPGRRGVPERLRRQRVPRRVPDRRSSRRGLQDRVCRPRTPTGSPTTRR